MNTDLIYATITFILFIFVIFIFMVKSRNYKQSLDRESFYEPILAPYNPTPPQIDTR